MIVYIRNKNIQNKTMKASSSCTHSNLFNFNKWERQANQIKFFKIIKIAQWMITRNPVLNWS